MSSPSSNNQSDTGGVADELLKCKQRLHQNLCSGDAITVEELQDCGNLNPYRDWFVSILNDANAL